MNSESIGENDVSGCSGSRGEIFEDAESSSACILNENFVEVKLEIVTSESESLNVGPGGLLHLVKLNPQPLPEGKPSYSFTFDYNKWNPNSSVMEDSAKPAYFPLSKAYGTGPDYPQFPSCDDTANEPVHQSFPSTCQLEVDDPAYQKSGISQEECSKSTFAEKTQAFSAETGEKQQKLLIDLKEKEQTKSTIEGEENLILFEMQKTQALINECKVTEIKVHKAHLEQLRKRHPDVWIQFVQELSAVKKPCKTKDKVPEKRFLPTLSDAERRRYYRKKMKEENPEYWAALKEKEASKKREQRGEKRNVLLEMQKTKDLISHSNHADASEHRARLESLKEKYPDLWHQLEDAIAATKLRTEMMLQDRDNKKRRFVIKPIETYKDVIEAHKKFVYRQKLKEERPKYFAELKARNALAKSRSRTKSRISSFNYRLGISSVTSVNARYDLCVSNHNYTLNPNNYVLHNKSVRACDYHLSTNNDQFGISVSKNENLVIGGKNPYSLDIDSSSHAINSPSSHPTVSTC